jgi:myo-inositol-1-phosphate synthase
MVDPVQNRSDELLIMAAGVKGAIGTTVALALAQWHTHPASIAASLITSAGWPGLGPAGRMHLAGWDTDSGDMTAALRRHGVVPASAWEPHADALSRIPVREAPAPGMPLSEQVAAIRRDMEAFMTLYPAALPVWVNLLPAACDLDPAREMDSLEALMQLSETVLPDLAYTLAALEAGVPMVNFTPNAIELPVICQEAARRGIPIAGRDGKTGQTYFKVVLASALKARALYVDGWYSLNILGNSDGRNLMDPDRACGKLNNKTRLLDEILGYAVGERYGAPSHKVHIDYYPPRGDAKEAWDVIDFTGLFGLPMSLRLNLQGRDSILAAPLVLDLARWAAALKKAGIAGPVAELGFFFKKPVGPDPPLTFQNQWAALETLAERIGAR